MVIQLAIVLLPLYEQMLFEVIWIRYKRANIWNDGVLPVLACAPL